MAAESETLARFVHGAVADGAVAASQLETMRWCVLDNLAAGYLGGRQPWFRRISSALGTARPGGSSSSFGHADRVDAATAALINGAAIGAFEIEHGRSGAHCGATVFPAVFALAQQRGISGRAFLRALAIGYEADIRIAQAHTTATESQRGFHSPALSGVFGAAVGCCVVMGLPLEKIRAAIGIAASHACGIIEYVWEGAETKRLHCGRAAQFGLESALLANAGLTAPTTALEGEYGYFRAYSPAPRPDLVTADLGSVWRLDDISIKPYPAHGTVVPFVPVLDQIRRSGISPDELVEIVISTTPDASEPRHLDCEPGTVLGAQYSVPYLMATVLVHGKDKLIELDEGALSDPVVIKTARKFVITRKPGATGKGLNAGGDITVQTTTGTSHYTAAGIGTLSADELEEVVTGKFNRYADHALSAAHRREAIRRVRELAVAPDLAGIADYVALAGHR